MIFFTHKFVLITFALLTLVKLGKGKHCTSGFYPNPNTGFSACTDKDNTWVYPIEDCSYNPGHTGRIPRASGCDSPFERLSLDCMNFSPLNGAHGCTFINSKGNYQTIRCKTMSFIPSCKEGRGQYVPPNSDK
ncbi:secreted protein [Melampsora americana]|nr:secreted protein [Melampsora americana]